MNLRSVILLALVVLPSMATPALADPGAFGGALSGKAKHIADDTQVVNKTLPIEKANPNFLHVWDHRKDNHPSYSNSLNDNSSGSSNDGSKKKKKN